METFSALLALCAGISPVTGECPSQKPVTRSFYVLFDLHLNKRLSKQSSRRWFETPSRSLWHHCNVIPYPWCDYQQVTIFFTHTMLVLLLHVPERVAITLSLFCSLYYKMYWFHHPGAYYTRGRFKNVYELANLRALKFSILNKNRLFQSMRKLFGIWIWIASNLSFENMTLVSISEYHTLQSNELWIWGAFTYKSSTEEGPLSCTNILYLNQHLRGGFHGLGRTSYLSYTPRRLVR